MTKKIETIGSVGNAMRLRNLASVVVFTWVASLSLFAQSIKTVVLSSPTAGSVVRSTITLQCAVDSGVVQVEYLRDGVLVGTSTTPPFSISFNTATATDGSHSLVA